MDELKDGRVERTSVALATEIEAAVLRWTLRRVEVTSNEAVGGRYRLVTLAGESLKQRSFTPGDMFQLAFPGWQSRAYTPFAYDAKAGSAQFLGYLHGNGVASAWLASAHAGETRFVLGPRSAVNLATLQRPLLLFGDETSLGTAAALRASPLGLAGVQLVFEVSSPGAARAALERLGLAAHATVFERGEAPTKMFERGHDDAHFEAVEATIGAFFERSPGAHGVFTGVAPSIKRLYKAMRRRNVPSKQIINLAYWAPGRKGFSGVQR